MSLSSLPLHFFFLPPQTLLSSSTDPSLICTSSTATDPSLPTFPLSVLNPPQIGAFCSALHSFRFNREGPSHIVGSEIGQLVSVRARFVDEDRETVPLSVGLVGWYRIGQSIGDGFWFGCVDFFGFLFCSSSLVLMGMAELWLCSDFYGFDGGWGCVLVQWNIILLLCLYYFIVLKAKIAPPL